VAVDHKRRAAYVKAYKEKYRAYLAEKARERLATPEGRELVRKRHERYRKRHQERVKQHDKKYRDANALLVQVRKKLRARRVRLATPPWVDMNAVKAIYIEAARTGMAVDHIIPLNSPIVCGLHVENNLQLLTKRQNSSKGNKFTPEVTYGA
jgi:5-methylcytosine-specific restriction endonuclease McrA